jgi:hypothetical protein
MTKVPFQIPRQRAAQAARCDLRIAGPVRVGGLSGGGSEEAGPVTATVDHADIRGLGTTVQVSVAAPASL